MLGTKSWTLFRARRLAVPAILGMAGTLLAGRAAFPQAPADDVAEEAARFARIYAAVERNAMGPVDPDRAIWDGAIRAMLARLDPFSAFFDREQFKLLQQQTRGEALGFGSILYVQPGKVLVLQTAVGSPSARAGLGPGDEIVQVNGVRIDRLDFQSLVQLLQESRSHPVRLAVIHPGSLVAHDFELNPAEVALPTADKTFLLPGGVGYIHLTSFEQKTPQEVLDALNRLGGAKLKGLLLDLRDNRGGMLDAALGVVSVFLKPDLAVLTVRGRAGPEKTYRTAQAPASYSGPLIVLVNANTASAAEIVAAALEEHDRAVIAGEPTFGKGVVEGVFTLGEETGLALTTAQYFTPSGRFIQRPLPGTALEFPAGRANPGYAGPSFHTDLGRPLAAGGGIRPDVEIPARSLDPWAAFLEQRGAFTTFASQWLTLHGKVAESWDPDSRVLEEFREFLTRSRIRVPPEYWRSDQSYLKLRIKTELVNLVFGLARGNEVEVRGDPQVQKATALFPKVPELLQTPALKPGTLHTKRIAGKSGG